MTRTEMITEIAKQAHCSKRLVRKKLFQLLTRFKKNDYQSYKRLKFKQSFLNRNTDWHDWYEWRDKCDNGLIDNWTFWRTPNVFEVAFFSSGCVVLFRVEEVYDDGYQNIGTCGARLYNY